MKLILSTLVTTWLANIAFHLRPIWQQNLVAIDSESLQTSFQSFCRPPSQVAVLFDSNLSRRPFLGQVAFHLRQLLQTLVAIDSESRHTLFQSVCAPPSEVAVLCYSSLSRCPFLRQVVDLDLLLCTGFNLENAVLFLCHIFNQRPMNYSKIEQSNGRHWALVWSATTSRPFQWKFHFHWKKKSFVTARYLQSIKTFFTVELSEYCKSGSTFSSSEPVEACSNCSRLGNFLCLCSPVLSAQAVLERGTKSLAIDFAVKSFDCLLELTSGVIARWQALVCRGSNLDSNLISAAWPMGCRSFICSETPK